MEKVAASGCASRHAGIVPPCSEAVERRRANHTLITPLHSNIFPAPRKLGRWRWPQLPWLDKRRLAGNAMAMVMSDDDDDE